MHTIVLYSGGIDSTTLLYDLHTAGHTLAALSVAYGQRHGIELQSAQRVCALLGLEHRVVDLGALRPFLGGSSQTDDRIPVPHGHYADPSMKQTIVPNRNMLLLAMAAAWAISCGAASIAYAAHSGDHPIYPDCRPAFVTSMQAAFAVCDWRPLTLLTPYLSWDKTAIVRRGHALGVPFAQTWSCYDPQPVLQGVHHCGRCGTCVERRLAFAEAALCDPTEYVYALDIDQNLSF